MDDSPHCGATAGLARWLAVDTSTDRLSVAVGAAGAAAPLAQHDGLGGPQASVALLPAIRALLQTVGWSLASLDGIAFGRGPGSFTGLRTACAVVQGLAVAARPGGIPVLPLDTLLAVAEAARHDHAPDARALRVVAALDARMGEVYAAVYDWHAERGWTTVAPAHLTPPEDVSWAADATSPVSGCLRPGSTGACRPTPARRPCCAWRPRAWRPASVCRRRRRNRCTCATRWR
jgi:tRNA threonylcarbamoyladenosine biosynthesis protein TsaB